VIREVLPGTAAAHAGLEGAEVDRRGRVRVGDIIVGIDDFTVSNYDDLFTALDQHKVGDRVIVRYMRGRREKAAEVELIELDH
jgi:S1-C subfamily serine protease